jgi:hypothetical protein
LPAVVFGSLSRGGSPPDSPGQLAEDLALYAGGAPIFFGRVAAGYLTGWNNSLGMSAGAVEAPARFLRDVHQGVVGGKWNERAILKDAAETIGSWIPGSITAQMIRTAEGAQDLSEGDADDARRLLWSKWALEKEKKESGRKHKMRKHKTRSRK